MATNSSEIQTFEFLPDFEIQTNGDPWEKDSERLYHCRLCSEKFLFFISLSCHMHLEHSQNDSALEENHCYCEVCGENFEDEKDKRDHMNFKHFAISKNNNNKNKNLKPTSGENIVKNNVGIPRKPNFLLKIRASEDAPLLSGIGTAVCFNELLKRQKITHHGEPIMDNDENEKLIECIMCPNKERISHNRQAQLHIRSHRNGRTNGDKLFRCVKCPEVELGSDAEITEHMESHHPKLFQSHRCCFCSFGTQKACDLLLHKRSMHPTIPHYNCSDCFTKFFNQNDLKFHISKAHPESANVCQICKKGFLSKDSKKAHIKKDHPQDDDEEDDQNVNEFEKYAENMDNFENPALLGCSKCNGIEHSWSDFPSYRIHIRTAHNLDESGCQCAICKITFKCQRDFQCHLRQKHGREFRRYRCKSCRFGSDFKPAFVEHITKMHPDIERIICEECPLSTANYFPNEDSLKRHQYMRHRQQNFDCKQCTEKFINQSELRKHMLRKHKRILEARINKSQIQNNVTKSESHQTKFTNEDIENMKRNPSFTCFKGCGFETDSCPKLKTHMEYEHEYFDRNIIQCKLCGYLVYKRDHLYSHMQKHITTQEYICQCGNSYKCDRSLKAHKRRSQCEFSDSKLNPNLNEEATNNVRGETSLVCDHCGRFFDTSHRLRRHRVKEHQDFFALPVVCEICQQRFVSSTTLQRHQQETNHFWRPAGEIQTCQLVKTCSENFLTLDDLKLHIKQKHHGLLCSSKNVCPNCGWKFNRADTFRKHIGKGKCHEKDNCCPALACDFTSEIRNEIEKHISLIHDGQPYHCDGCSDKFKDWSSIRSHILKAHAAEHLKVCEVCGASYFEKRDYIRHLQSNACSATTDIPKYENAEPECCDECGKIFQKRSNLRKHREDFHGVESEDRIHACNTCGQKFASRSGLGRHNNIWHKYANPKDGDGTTCGHCGEKFQTPQNWRAHLQRVHGITPKTEKHNYPAIRHSSKN